jgi:pilus assembly protein FimV
VSTQPVPLNEPLHSLKGDGTLSFDPVMSSTTPAAAASGPSSGFAMEFDLSAISLDLDGPGETRSAVSAPAAAPMPDLSGFDIGPNVGADGGDPLTRKVELAEEFRQIGDMEGARDLLQEVVAKADGSLKSKAQVMLDSLA